MDGFEALKALHLEYLGKIREQSLLSPKAQMVLNSVKKILNISVKLRSAFEILSSLSVSTQKSEEIQGLKNGIQQLDTEFTQSSGFLLRIVETVVKQKPVPHCNFLIFF